MSFPDTSCPAEFSLVQQTTQNICSLVIWLHIDICVFTEYNEI
jgi:hypothetical protein